MTPEAALSRGLAELAPRLPAPLPEGAPAKLMAYLDLLMKWNRTHNLTAVRDPLRSVSHHLLDSLAVLPELPPGALAVRAAACPASRSRSRSPRAASP